MNSERVRSHTKWILLHIHVGSACSSTVTLLEIAIAAKSRGTNQPPVAPPRSQLLTDKRSPKAGLGTAFSTESQIVDPLDSNCVQFCFSICAHMHGWAFRWDPSPSLFLLEDARDIEVRPENADHDPEVFHGNPRKSPQSMP